MSGRAVTKRAVSALTKLAGEINAEHEAAERAMNDSLQHARRCGELLIEAKAGCGHGAWGGWLAENFVATHQTATGYMRIAERWTELPPPQNENAFSIRKALALLSEPRDTEPEMKHCEHCGKEWLADLGCCPYCNMTPEARIAGLERANRESAPPIPTGPPSKATGREKKDEPTDWDSWTDSLGGDREPAPQRPVAQRRRPYTERLKALVAASMDASEATDEEIGAIPANDMMLRGLRSARDLLGRIIAHHDKEAKHG